MKALLTEINKLVYALCNVSSYEWDSDNCPRGSSGECLDAPRALSSDQPRSLRQNLWQPRYEILDSFPPQTPDCPMSLEFPKTWHFLNSELKFSDLSPISIWCAWAEILLFKFLHVLMKPTFWHQVLVLLYFTFYIYIHSHMLKIIKILKMKVALKVGEFWNLSWNCIYVLLTWRK